VLHQAMECLRRAWQPAEDQWPGIEGKRDSTQGGMGATCSVV